MQISLKKKLAAAATVLTVVGGAGVALAYWTTGGTGAGTAGTGSANAITVNQSASPTALVPNGTTTLSGTFTNTTNPGPVYITSVKATINTFSLQADLSKPACTQADFTLTTDTATVGADIPNGTGVGSWSGIVLKMVNAATNQDNCKSITVPLSYVAS